MGDCLRGVYKELEAKYRERAEKLDKIDTMLTRREKETRQLRQLRQGINDSQEASNQRLEQAYTEAVPKEVRNKVDTELEEVYRAAEQAQSPVNNIQPVREPVYNKPIESAAVPTDPINPIIVEAPEEMVSENTVSVETPHIVPFTEIPIRQETQYIAEVSVPQQTTDQQVEDRGILGVGAALVVAFGTVYGVHRIVKKFR